MSQRGKGPTLNSNHRRPDNKTSKGSCCLTKSAWGVVICILLWERADSTYHVGIFFSTITSQFAPLSQFNPLHLCLDSQETQYRILKRALEHGKYCPAHTYIHGMLKTIWRNTYSNIYIYIYTWLYKWPVHEWKHLISLIFREMHIKHNQNNLTATKIVIILKSGKGVKI